MGFLGRQASDLKISYNLVSFLLNVFLIFVLYLSLIFSRMLEIIVLVIILFELYVSLSLFLEADNNISQLFEMTLDQIHLDHMGPGTWQ